MAVCGSFTDIDFPVDTFDVSLDKSLWQVTTIKVFEIQTNVDTINTFKDVVMLQQELAQKLDWVALV